MSNLLQNPSILILATATAIALILYLREYNKRKILESAGDKFLKNLKEKGWETLHQSIKKSEDIVGQAELEGIKVVAESKFETAKLEDEYSKKLSEAIQASEQNITAAQGQFMQFMQDLQRRSAEFEEASKSAGEQRINQLFDRVEVKLSDFLIQTEQKTASSIELELTAARQMVDTYKNQRLKLIDENIIAMMEQTLAVILGKKLSLNDQLDLVYEALEKAKVEKFIV